MLKRKVIRRSISSWTSPVTLVPKKEGEIRFCIDYRRLNAITRDDLYPTPRLEEPLHLMKGCDRFSIMDCDSCYWQIPLDEESKEKSTFICHLGTFSFNVMPFGLKSAPASCVRTMDTIFRNENRKISFIYMDDLICYSKGTTEHLRRLMILFRRMEEFGLKLKPKKCFFANKSVDYLGHTITEEGVSPEMSRVRDYCKKPRPTDIGEVRSFLGFVGFYRRFIHLFSKIAEPLNRLLKKKAVFVWKEEQETAYRILKNSLLRPPILTHYNPEAELELRTDASNAGLGAHLVQIEDGQPKLLACASRTLTPNEKNYGVTEKECLAIIWAVKRFRPYLFGRKFTIVTDHCGLTYLMTAKDLANRLARWSLTLMDYQFDIQYNKGKLHTDADFLSRNPFAEEREQMKKRKTEDASPKEENIRIRYIGNFTDLGVEEIDEFTPERMTFEQRDDPILNRFICKLSDPETSSSEKLRIEKLYVIRDGLLKRRVTNRGLYRELLCIPKSMVMTVLNHAHDTPVAGHFGIRKTLWRIAQSFYWIGFVEDVKNYVLSCHECQKKKTPSTTTHGLQRSIPIGEEVLAVMSFDIMGPLPLTEDGKRYILTLTDQISKFAIAIPLPNQEEETIIDALEKEVFFKFDPPRVVLTDQGANLLGNYGKHFYRDWGIRHLVTSPYHPQANGQVEKFNRTLGERLSILATKYEKEWDIFVPSTVYAYNSTYNETTKYSPLELLIGRNPDLPLARLLGHFSLDAPAGDARREEINAMREEAKRNIEESQRKSRIYANKSRKPCELKKGDEVLLLQKHLKLQKGGKLYDRWKGPLIIVESHKDDSHFGVRRPSGGRSWTVHSSHLKKYYSRRDFRLCTDRNTGDIDHDQQDPKGVGRSPSTEEERDVPDQPEEETIRHGRTNSRSDGQNTSQNRISKIDTFVANQKSDFRLTNHEPEEWPKQQ